MEERSPHEVLELVASEGVEFVDLRFCDLPGVMQHVTIPAAVLDEGQFEDGHAFDGSSVRGFQQIQESDMVLIADPNTAYVDPFRPRKTLVHSGYARYGDTWQPASSRMTDHQRETSTEIVWSGYAVDGQIDERIMSPGAGER